MSETYTPTPQTESESEFDKQTDISLDLANGVPAERPQLVDDIEFFNSAAGAARRIEIGIQDVPSTAQEVPVLHEKPSTARRVIAGAAGVAIAGGAIAVTAEAFKPAEFEGKTTYMVEDGEGLQNAAEQIAGIETVDIRDGIDSIAGDPANIDVLKDGLQRYEVLQIPIKVKGYEEQK